MLTSTAYCPKIIYKALMSKRYRKIAKNMRKLAKIAKI